MSTHRKGHSFRMWRSVEEKVKEHLKQTDENLTTFLNEAILYYLVEPEPIKNCPFLNDGCQHPENLEVECSLSNCPFYNAEGELIGILST